MTLMMVSALFSAVLYGVGAAVEQRQAAAAPEESAGKPRLLAVLARQPIWLLGIAAQFAGFAAHAVALRFGPLAVVQMVMAGELIVAVLLARRWSGRRLSRSSWFAALVVMAGIASFAALTAQAAGGQVAGVPRHRTLIAVAVLGIGSTALAGTGLKAAGRRRAVLLSVAAGLADAAMAVITMGFAHVAGHGLVAVVTSWTVYGVIVAGIGNVLLTQTAYQTGRPMITLPIISAVTPMASVVIGVGILGEGTRMGAASAAAAGLAAVVTCAALVVLARSVPAGHAAPAPRPASRVLKLAERLELSGGLPPGSTSCACVAGDLARVNPPRGASRTGRRHP